MSLEEYRRKRDFRRTPEPPGAEPGPAPTPRSRPDRPTAAGRGRPRSARRAEPGAGAQPVDWAGLPSGRRFCVQMHRARRLHWDLRLEHAGVLLSWAVPKGPTQDAGARRLAVHVEDHPVEYGGFEGVIPDGYGAGTVLLWDAGTVEWVRESAPDPGASLARGDLKFRLAGRKLHGEFALVRLGRRGGRSGRRAREAGGAETPADPQGRDWLLIKKRDGEEVAGSDAADLEVSVLTGRDLAGIASGPPPHPHAPGGGSGEPEQAAVPGAGGEAAELLGRAPLGAVPADAGPMLATPLGSAFSREGWLFEVKYDGVRIIARVDAAGVRLRGRRGRDETRRYPELAELAGRLTVSAATVDGEVVALDAEGRPSFELLQQRINLGDLRQTARLRERVPVTFMAFDILGAAGHDLRGLPLRERKRLLRLLLRDGGAVRYADHVEGAGEELFAALAARGIEGMVAKDGASAYEAGRRASTWLKVRAWRSQDCAICGVTAGRGGRGPIGALVLGVVDAGQLVHCGRVGSGLDESMLSDLGRRLRPVERCPFEAVPRTDTAVTWMRPELVCSVRHIGWTSAGTLRHPTYRGLRPELGVEDCVRERERTKTEALAAAAAASSRPASAPARPGAPADADALEALRAMGAEGSWEIGGRRLRLTNLDKPLWPAEGITKRDMVEYYVRAAPLLLPYLRDRPVGMQVFPDGIDGKHFWRKRIPDHAPDWIRTWTHRGERSVTYVIADEVATLAWMANGGVVDIHPWHSRMDAPDRPDWAVFDLDPFPPAGFDEVLTLARLVHAALDHYGLRGLAKTSGQTGLQIYVPIERGPRQDEVRAWVEEVSRAIGRVAPELVSWDWEVARRGGRVRIDYTQNVVGKTLAAAWSLRPAPRAPVSTPLTWADLDDPALRSDRWTIADALDRAAEGDPFLPVLDGGQSLPVL